MIASPAIEVHELAKTYRDGLLRRSHVAALRGVSFATQRGEIFGLLGPNGAGKTTFIKILLGIIRKTGGDAQVLGAKAGSRAARRQIGYLPEHLRIQRYQTPYTALDLYGKLSNLSGREIRSRRDKLLETVGLTGWEKQSVRKFSKGMLQRLGLAQALLHEPQLLVLDEPTDGLDPVGRAQVRTILKQLRDEGKTIFLNSHILQEVELVCDRVAILHRGELRFVGAAHEIPVTDSGRIHFRLQGEEVAVRAALIEHEPLAWRIEAEELHDIALGMREQAEVDRVIDRLRAAGVSILAIQRQRLSLEEAFLQVLAGSDGAHGSSDDNSASASADAEVLNAELTEEDTP